MKTTRLLIDGDAIHTPGQNAKMWLAGLLGSREVRWDIILDDQVLWVPNQSQKHPWEFNLHAHIVKASFVAGVDERVANQREAITRLAEHLKQHCPQLMGQGSCEHMPV